MSFVLTDQVDRWIAMARRFFYAVALLPHGCPHCGGSLSMVHEGLCRCEACGRELDPTLKFQRCAACGEEPTLRIRRYQCRQCGADVPSRFLFDGLAFDADYFKIKMAESRQRHQELRDRVREMLAASRSRDLVLPPVELGEVPGLIDALNGLTAGLEPVPPRLRRDGFDLVRYESHLQAHIGPIAVRFEDLPPLSENSRQDRIWRFIAVLFLDQAGEIELWQDGPTIMVRKREADREGQGISGETEAAV
jgi:hypothetical protein